MHDAGHVTRSPRTPAWLRDLDQLTARLRWGPRLSSKRWPYLSRGERGGVVAHPALQLRVATSDDDRWQPRGERVADRDRASAVPRLGAGELAVDDRAAHVDPRLRCVEVGVHDPQGDRLGDPQTGRGQQFEERPPFVWDLGQRPRELLACEEATLVEPRPRLRLGSKITGSAPSRSRPARTAWRRQDCRGNTAFRTERSVSR